MTFFILPLVVCALFIAVVPFVRYFFRNYINESNSQFAIWFRNKYGPTIPSAKHALENIDIDVLGFCKCGRAIHPFEGVWLIADIPEPTQDNDQKHLLLYTDTVLVRVANCIFCRGNPESSDIFAIFDYERNVKMTPPLGAHRELATS